jgi:hypothetical protein
MERGVRGGRRSTKARRPRRRCVQRGFSGGGRAGGRGVVKRGRGFYGGCHADECFEEADERQERNNAGFRQTK